MSAEIASNCPNYVAMLADSVRDLDENSLWSMWRSSSEDDGGGSGLSYGKKVYCIAKEKGDKGLLPFLESIGLTLSSSTHVARHLSSHSLPTLVSKVNYVKEMFFSGSDDDGGLIGRNARRMLMHLSIPTDEDLQQTLSFFEKMEARRGGLNILGFQDAAFKYMIESFPRLLLLPLESHMKPFVDFLEDIGIPRRYMRNVLLLFPPIIFYDIEMGIKQKLRAFREIGAADKDIGKMLIKYPWIVSTSVQENYEEIIDFFEDEKVPNESVNRSVKSWPHILGSSTSKLKLMVEQCGGLGIGKKKMGQVIASSPQLLLKKPHEFLKVVSFFEDLGFDRKFVGRILGRCPEIFCTNSDKTLKKKLEFLVSIGVLKDHLPQVVIKYPELFVCDVDRSLRPRIKYLMKIGLSKRDIRFMVRGFSPLLGYSIDQVFRPKVEFLVYHMKRPVKDVVEYPRYFSYSLEKKIKPRFLVLKRRNIDCSLKEMLAKNDEDFAEDFMGIGNMHVPPPPEL